MTEIPKNINPIMISSTIFKDFLLSPLNTQLFIIFSFRFPDRNNFVNGVYSHNETASDKIWFSSHMEHNQPSNCLYYDTAISSALLHIFYIFQTKIWIVPRLIWFDYNDNIQTFPIPTVHITYYLNTITNFINHYINNFNWLYTLLRHYYVAIPTKLRSLEK